MTTLPVHSITWLAVGLLLTVGCGPTSERRPEPAVQEQVSSPPPPDAWLKDGAPAGDTDNMKSKDGFGAQLRLTESQRFFEDWNKPEPPRFPETSEARRNIPIFAAILFVDPGTDDAQRAKVTCHLIVRKPDGTVYGEDDVVGLDGAYSVPAHDLQLAEGRMGIRIEPHDPVGVYTVEATVRDEVKNVELELKTTFNVPQ